MQISRAAVFYNAHKPQNAPLAEAVCGFLRTRHVAAQTVTGLERLDGVELLVSIGGDGTMLRCARACAPLHIPIFGINGGTLGFLAASEPDDAEKNLQLFLQGTSPLRERAMLQVTVHIPGQKPLTHLALNDCVLRAAQPRAYTLKATFNEREIPPYFGDGVIVATPTGSSAYSLAAGGPIVEPGVEVWVLTPICPHTLNQRPLVLPAQGVLNLSPELKNPGDTTSLSIDGQINLTLPPGTSVTLTQSPHKARLVTTPGRDFFALLHRKLSWGAR